MSAAMTDRQLIAELTNALEAISEHCTGYPQVIAIDALAMADLTAVGEPVPVATAQSPYLRRPIRSLGEALADRADVARRAFG